MQIKLVNRTDERVEQVELSTEVNSLPDVVLYGDKVYKLLSGNNPPLYAECFAVTIAMQIGTGIEE